MSCMRCSPVMRRIVVFCTSSADNSAWYRNHLVASSEGSMVNSLGGGGSPALLLCKFTHISSQKQDSNKVQLKWLRMTPRFCRKARIHIACSEPLPVCLKQTKNSKSQGIDTRALRDRIHPWPCHVKSRERTVPGYWQIDDRSIIHTISSPSFGSVFA